MLSHSAISGWLIKRIFSQNYSMMKFIKIISIIWLLVLIGCNKKQQTLSWTEDENFANITSEKVTFKTADEIPLAGFLYLPKNIAPDSLESIMVWNSIYPNSQQTCTHYALRHVSFMGFWYRIGQFTFDYRGIGLSGGRRDVDKIQIDVAAAHNYLVQRFQNNTKIIFNGQSALELADGIKKFTIEPDWQIQARIFKPRHKKSNARVVFLSDFYQWSSADDSLARAIADAGVMVYGLNLLRCLVDGSMREPISILKLRQAFFTLAQKIRDQSGIILVGRGLGAAVALSATPNTQYLMGLVGIDIPSTSNFQNPHIKTMLNMIEPQDYDLARIAEQLQTRRLYLIYDQNPLNESTSLARFAQFNFTRQEALAHPQGLTGSRNENLVAAILRGINFVRLEF